MGTLISDKFLFNSNLQSLPFFQFKLISPRSPFFLQLTNRKSIFNQNPPNFYSIPSSNSTKFGGWDDLNLIEDSKHSGKLDQFQHFLVSIGIDDRKHIFMFLLGFVSALAISRVRVSSILVIPASVLVFGVGFSLGFVQRGGWSHSVKEVGRNGSKRSYKDENFRASVEKLRSLVELFGEIDVKITNFEKGIKEALGNERIEFGELESYYKVIESMSLDILLAKELIDGSISDLDVLVSVGESMGDLIDDGDVKKSSNQRKRGQGASYFDIFQLFGRMFQENLIGAKPIKVKDKDVSKREMVEQLKSKVVNSQTHSSDVVDRSNRLQERIMDSAPLEASKNEALRQHGTDRIGDGPGKTEVIQNMINENSTGAVNEIKRLESNGYFGPQNGSVEFINNHGNFLKMGNHNGNEMLMPRDGLYEPLELDVNMKSRDLRSFSMESEGYVQEEQTHKTSNGAYMPSYSGKKGENGSYRFDYKEKRQKFDTPSLGNPQAAYGMEEDLASLSSVLSEDVLFDKHLTKATDLLKQARQCLKGKVDEERAEVILYKSARLLTRAIGMKPMSLLAVGQLGNTFLLHGEVKLRIARELRTLLSRSDSFSRDQVRRIQVKGLNEQVINRERIACILIDVCEECEELLIEAGRRYRMALSIDGSDVRALYNWGLALSYRAQLISDIGPGAAADADKVYLAAIDKFDAMMSRSSACAPDALFRWGVALQQRSRLRPSNSKEKTKLLHQAKRLFEDALDMDSNNDKVREALSSCISELNHRYYSY